jgi:hypothetical protein
MSMARPPRKPEDDERTPQETERIRERTLKRILSTPPKRHADMIAERKVKRDASAEGAERPTKRER